MLDEFLEDVLGDAVPPAWEDWWTGIRKASLPDLPDEPTPDQLEAWLELAELLADAGFRDRWREMAVEAHATPGPQISMDLRPLFDDALRAKAAGVAPEDPAADALVERLLAVHESVVVEGPDLAKRTLEHVERYDDPLTRRYGGSSPAFAACPRTGPKSWPWTGWSLRFVHASPPRRTNAGAGPGRSEWLTAST